MQDDAPLLFFLLLLLSGLKKVSFIFYRAHQSQICFIWIYICSMRRIVLALMSRDLPAVDLTNTTSNVQSDMMVAIRLGGLMAGKVFPVTDLKPTEI